MSGFEEVFNKLVTGRLDDARKLLRPLVKSGDLDAMFLLGRVRWEGRNTVPANADGFRWFKEAAQMGHLYGKLYAAIAYFNGIGVTKNRTKGRQWLEDCASRGCAVAQLELASLYLEADGVDYDLEKAIGYLTQAANQPGKACAGQETQFAYSGRLDEFVASSEAEAIANAQEYLAYLYSGQEEDVPRNASLAAHWAAKAVVAGFEGLVWPLIELHLELASTDEAKQLLIKLAQKNDARAMYELARLYEKSTSKEEREQVYRLDMEARKGGYVPAGHLPPPRFQKPTRPHFYEPDLLDEEEWPSRLDEARQRSVDDPLELRLKVRTLHLLARSGSDLAERELEELIPVIGEEKYLVAIHMRDPA